MSKSISLTQLRQQNANNVQQNGNVVNDILQEIQNQQGNQPMNQMQAQNQPTMELPPMNSQQVNAHTPGVIPMVPLVQPSLVIEEETRYEKVMKVLKDPLVVGAIILLISMRQVRGMLFNLIPDRVPFLRHKDTLLIVLQALVGVALKYVVNEHLLE